MKKMMLILAMAILLSGCATHITSWSPKATQSTEEFWKDRQQCDYWAFDQRKDSQNFGTNLADHYGFQNYRHQKYFDQCMEEKGYIKK